MSDREQLFARHEDILEHQLSEGKLTVAEYNAERMKLYANWKTPTETIEEIRDALVELGFERIDARNPDAPIAVKHFIDGDLEVTVHFGSR